jgi:hypothetical protein
MWTETVCAVKLIFKRNHSLLLLPALVPSATLADSSDNSESENSGHTKNNQVHRNNKNNIRLTHFDLLMRMFPKKLLDPPRNEPKNQHTENSNTNVADGDVPAA